MADNILTYKRTRKTVRKWGDIVVDRIKDRLRSDKTIASSRTVNSVKGELKVYGSIISYGIYSRDANGRNYTVLEVIDKGRKPGKKPPMQEILYWMRKKGVHPKGGGGRFIKKTESNMRTVAYRIAKSIGERGTIKRFGWQGSNVLTWAFTKVEGQMTMDIVDSMRKDIEEHIEDNSK